MSANPRKNGLRIDLTKCGFPRIHKNDPIRRKRRIWSHLLKKLLIENFIFWAVWLLWDSDQVIVVQIKSSLSND